MSPQDEQVVTSVNTQLTLLSQVIEKVNDLALKSTSVLSAHEERLSNLEDEDGELGKTIQKLDTRLTAIEKWKWSIVGGLALLITIISVLSIAKFFN